MAHLDFWSSAIASGFQAAGRRNGKRIRGKKQVITKNNISALHIALLIISSWPDLNHMATYSYKKDWGDSIQPVSTKY